MGATCEKHPTVEVKKAALPAASWPSRNSTNDQALPPRGPRWLNKAHETRDQLSLLGAGLTRIGDSHYFYAGPLVHGRVAKIPSCEGIVGFVASGDVGTLPRKQRCRRERASDIVDDVLSGGLEQCKLLADDLAGSGSDTVMEALLCGEGAGVICHQRILPAQRLCSFVTHQDELVSIFASAPLLAQNVPATGFVPSCCLTSLVSSTVQSFNVSLCRTLASQQHLTPVTASFFSPLACAQSAPGDPR
ncbi:hypothetical protein VDGL01_11452 [Verticillium dahliae]